MKRIVSRNELRGRAIGALVSNGFGVIWMVMALRIGGVDSPLALGAVLVCGAVLLAGTLLLFREARRRPPAREHTDMWRGFAWALGLEALAIVVGLSILARLHLEIYDLSLIAAIVGLHMFPLARIFRYQQHYVTGAVMVAWVLLTVWLAPQSKVLTVTALGTGVILWLSGVAIVLLARHLLRRTLPAVTPGAA